MATSSQDFIARNRAPRVQIDYKVETGDAQRTVSLPFVAGVLADLSGKPVDPLPNLDKRKFSDVDIGTFDRFMESTKPRVAFPIRNVLSGEGNLAVDLTFEKMDDFSPDAVAAKVDGLKQLLQARSQLANLITWLDGKAPAEELIGRLIQDAALLQTIAATKKPVDPDAEPTPAS